MVERVSAQKPQVIPQAKALARVKRSRKSMENKRVKDMKNESNVNACNFNEASTMSPGCKAVKNAAI